MSNAHEKKKAAISVMSDLAVMTTQTTWTTRTSHFLSLSDLVLSRCFTFLNSIEHQLLAATHRALRHISKNRLALPAFVMYMLAGQQYDYEVYREDFVPTCNYVTEHGHVRALANCGAARCYSGAVRWNRYLYLIGGGGSSLVERCDLHHQDKTRAEENKWQPVQSTPVRLSSASAVLVENKIYVVGSATGYTSGVLATYDPSADTWEMGPCPQHCHFLTGLVALGRRLFAFNEEQYYYHSEIFDLETQKWSNMAKQPVPPICGPAVAIGPDCIILIGGVPSEQNICDEEHDNILNFGMPIVEYTPSTDSWRKWDLIKGLPQSNYWRGVHGAWYNSGAHELFVVFGNHHNVRRRPLLLLKLNLLEPECGWITVGQVPPTGRFAYCCV